MICTVYYVVCDSVSAKYCLGSTAWEHQSTQELAVEHAKRNSFIEHEGKHYCMECARALGIKGKK